MSRAARCWWSWPSSVALALLLAGCGGGAGGGAPRVEGPFGQGSRQFWVLRADGEPRAVVALLHGLARDSGLQLTPWLRHLAAEGDDVIYPRYEQPPPQAGARDFAVAGIRAGLAKLGRPKVPLVLVGYSRGGRLAVEAAATLKPAAAIAVYPGLINPSFEPATDLSKIPTATQVWLLVGDRDRTGQAGASELVGRLRSFAFPAQSIHGGVIRSGHGFSATHDSAMRSDPPARRAVWARVDRVIAGATRG